jgi:hypothetical protein
MGKRRADLHVALEPGRPSHALPTTGARPCEILRVPLDCYCNSGVNSYTKGLHLPGGRLYMQIEGVVFLGQGRRYRRRFPVRIDIFYPWITTVIQG